MKPKSNCFLSSVALALAITMLSGSTVPRAEALSATVRDLNEELRTRNEHHLRAQPDLPEEKRTPIIESRRDKRKQRVRWELQDGPIRLAVSLRPSHRSGDTKYRVPVLSVIVSGGAELMVKGVQGTSHSMSFLAQIVEMDPGNRYPEIVFSTFTGGAHCCSDTKILTSSKRGWDEWHLVDAGQFDGGPLRARDADRDGRFEIATSDNKFFYAFACYACSTTPLQILRLEGDQISNVSREPRYRIRHAAWLRAMIENVDDTVDLNGFLAGYVAQKILLGEGKDAWALMLKYYDRESDWGLEVCSVKTDSQYECSGRLLKVSYPESLRRFLTRNGYPLPE